MPNWCENKLTVTGPKKDLDKFKQKARKTYHYKNENTTTQLSLSKFLPMPKALIHTTAPPDKPNQKLINKYSVDNWYDWSIVHWGTKWDVTTHATHHTANSLVYCFDSAWTPPNENWMETVSAAYPKLSFILEYNEPGIGFSGTITARHGIAIDQCKNHTPDN